MSSFWDSPAERYLPTSCSAWWSLSTPPLPTRHNSRLQYQRWLQAVVQLLWDGPPDMMSLLWQYAPYRVCLDVALRTDSLSGSWPLDKLHRACVTVMCQLKVLQCFLQRQNCLIHHSNHGCCTEHATTAAGSRPGAGGGGWCPGGGRSGDGAGCYELSLCRPVFHPEGKLALHSSCCCPPGCCESGAPGPFADTLVQLARQL